MDLKRIAKMAEKIAPSDPETFALEQVDDGLEMILEGIMLVQEHIGKVNAYGDEQSNAKKAIGDILETALKPYTVDMFRVLKAFDA